MFLYKPKQNKQIIIKNSAIQNLNESLTDVVYHFTSLLSCYKIVKNNAFLLQTSMANASDNYNTKQLYYLSTTREKNANFGYARKFLNGGARITLNGRKLGQKYSAKPIEYWGNSMGKHEYYRGNSDFKTKQEHVRNETEDRIFSYDNSIRNAFEYIERIDLSIDTDKDEHVFIAYKMLLTGYGSKIFVYDNQDDFNKQSKNTINKTILDSEENYKYLNIQPDYGFNNENKYIKPIAKTLLVILGGEVDENDIIKESVKILKSYNLDKFINKRLFNQLKQGYFSYLNLIDDMQLEFQELSRKPTEDGHAILKIMSDYMKKHKLKNYSDLIKYKMQFGIIGDKYVERMIDDNKTVKIMTYENETYTRILIANPSKISLWTIIEDREYFAENMFNLGFDKHKSKDEESFRKYCERLSKKNLSVLDGIKIADNLGLSDEERKELFEYGTFQYKELNVYEALRYRLPEYANQTNFLYSKEYYENQNKIKQMFLKK